ncbi:Hypothetical protein Bdt_3720 [Bdellovibrio bacteriovorus str. Tiberius]|uniref:Uncharacterized protein n=1 Tax=Bdellovibrio bacteriovorus str. Tiberius TaxID=1069642 RepID=K7Z070_BDEBC|nr:Hypothetical protein Bdt_3720 [Bdellovibrio bacteriovorus str. Tiberius]
MQAQIRGGSTCDMQVGGTLFHHEFEQFINCCHRRLLRSLIQ